MKWYQLRLSLFQQAISPGLVETEFAQNMTGDAAAAAKLYSTLQAIKPEDVAASVMHVLTAPSHVEVFSLVFKPSFCI